MQQSYFTSLGRSENTTLTLAIMNSPTLPLFTKVAAELWGSDPRVTTLKREIQTH